MLSLPFHSSTYSFIVLHVLISSVSSSTSNETNLRPPVFTSKRMLELIVRNAGSQLTIRCKADGNPKPEIRWLKKGKPFIPEGEVSYISYGLKFDYLKTTDAGSYTCIVRNSQGSINFTSELEVVERLAVAPIIYEGKPANQTVFVGEKAVFNCQYMSDLHPFAIWVKIIDSNETFDDEIEEERSKTLMTSVGRNNTDKLLVLTLNNVSYNDSGKYGCIVKNTIGTSKVYVWLTVLERPSEIVPYNYNTIIIATCTAGIFVFLLIGIFVWYRRMKMEQAKEKLHITAPTQVFVRKRIVIQRQDTQASSAPLIKVEYPVVEFGDASTQFSEYDIPVDEDWEFNRERLVVGKILGHGAFGQVLEAQAFGLGGSSSPVTVAVKMLKDGHTDQDLIDLISEVEVMKMIGTHPNIINLLGCCTRNGPLFALVEYAKHGNLRDFLRSKRPSYGYEIPKELEAKTLTEKQLLDFAYQVSKGMNYLASRHCIHRDLAARNVLVMENYLVKVADFGFARDVHETYYYRKKKSGLLPVKWMAIEALFDRVFTTKSDVWSFGVLLWEIFTLGASPYPSISPEKLYPLLRSGHRMERPRDCSLSVYKVMQECWRSHSEERPTFSALTLELEKLLTNARDVEYLCLDIPYDQSSSEDEESDNQNSTGEE